MAAADVAGIELAKDETGTVEVAADELDGLLVDGVSPPAPPQPVSTRLNKAVVTIEVFITNS